MDIRLDTRTTDPGGSLRGTIAGAPPHGIRLVARATVATPFDEHVVDGGSAEVGDGPFDIDAPVWPLSSTGPLLTTTWRLEVVTESGSTLAAVPFVVAPADPSDPSAGRSLAIDVVADDDVDEPRRVLPPRVAAVAAIALAVGGLGTTLAFTTGSIIAGVVLAVIAVAAGLALAIGYEFGRRQPHVHDVHCRCDPHSDRISCTVVTARPDLDPGEITRIDATLMVVELARWERPTGGHAEQEEIVCESTIELARLDDRTWSGDIGLAPFADAPPSWSSHTELEHWSITWGVRFAVHTVDGDTTVHAVHLRSRLPQLDALVGGADVGDPRSLHRR